MCTYYKELLINIKYFHSVTFLSFFFLPSCFFYFHYFFDYFTCSFLYLFLSSTSCLSIMLMLLYFSCLLYLYVSIALCVLSLLSCRCYFLTSIPFIPVCGWWECEVSLPINTNDMLRLSDQKPEKSSHIIGLSSHTPSLSSYVSVHLFLSVLLSFLSASVNQFQPELLCAFLFQCDF